MRHPQQFRKFTIVPTPTFIISIILLCVSLLFDKYKTNCYQVFDNNFRGESSIIKAAIKFECDTYHSICSKMDRFTQTIYVTRYSLNFPESFRYYKGNIVETLAFWLQYILEAV